MTQAPLPPSHAYEPAEILVVDDREDALVALRATLDDPAYRLTEARSAEAALRTLLEHDFAVILLDLILPGMGGFELARLIKARERSRHVPILFMTASAEAGSLLLRAYAAGAADYLLKPLQPEVVRAKVRVFVNLHQLKLQVERQSERLQAAERAERELLLAQTRAASEERYRNLAEAMPQIVWRALPDGLVEYWNRRWFEYSRSDPTTPTGDLWVANVHPEDVRACANAWASALKREQVFSCECRLLGADGVYRWHLRRAVPEKNRAGETVGWIGTDTDIDDRRRADDEREELLQRERAARAEAESAHRHAAQLYEEASAAARLRDEFLTVAAHELRTPLTTLRMRAQMLARLTPPPEHGAEILRQVDRLTRLAEQLLDVGRLTTGRIQPELAPVDLREVLSELRAGLCQEAQQTGCRIELAADDPVVVQGDRLRLEQVVTNLVSNAIKYGRGKPIQIALTREGGVARLTVADQGIGIPREEQERIFERFGRVASTRSYGGLGLGLYIARQMVHAHGGSIAVESEPGRGARFIVELPLEQTALAPAPGHVPH